MSTSDARRLKAVVVDDHRLLAQSIAISLRQEGLDCSVAPLGDPASVLRSVIADRPDVVLLDLDLGGDVGDGGALVAPLVAAGCRVVLLTASTDPVRLAAAVEAGAVGVLAKTQLIDVLIATTTAAARREPVMSADQERALLHDARRRRASRESALAPFARLTEREAQVLRALGHGTSVATIAAGWCVAEATVRSQVRGVLVKLDVGSQLEAVALAHRVGWLSAGQG
jgi:DNA-binding NarL/FixJ family response regulator